MRGCEGVRECEGVRVRLKEKEKVKVSRGISISAPVVVVVVDLVFLFLHEKNASVVSPWKSECRYTSLCESQTAPSSQPKCKAESAESFASQIVGQRPKTQAQEPNIRNEKHGAVIILYVYNIYSVNCTTCSCIRRIGVLFSYNAAHNFCFSLSRR